MKIASLSAALAIFALSGCGDAKPQAPVKSESSGEPSVAPAAAGTVAAPRELRIEAGDQMKFSITRIEAAAGETLRVQLVNTGSAPKEAMGHNWVLLRSGVDATAFANAALGSKASDYFPESKAADVLAHTKLLGGGARDAVVFTVPADAAPGTEFGFLCTFPAHLQLGMKGVLVVR